MYQNTLKNMRSHKYFQIQSNTTKKKGEEQKEGREKKVEKESRKGRRMEDRKEGKGKEGKNRK